MCDFKEYCEDYLGDFDMEEECDEYGVPFISKEDYISWMFEIPLSLAKGCLVVRIDYGYGCVDEFLNNNFKCIASDHGRLQMGVLLSINIQSFSDVVTNSSSEIFCTITGNDLDSIYELLKPLFPSSYGYSDMEPTLYIEDGIITLWLPYGEQPVDFYRAGLEAILDKYFKDNYKIEYE